MKTYHAFRLAPASTVALRWYFLRAIGLGAAAAQILSGAACCARVVVDAESAGSSATTSTGMTTTTTTSTMTTTTTSTPVCDEPAIVYSQLTECIPKKPDEGCWPKDAPVVYGAIYTDLENQGCGGDLATVLCGPDMSVKGMCCYVVDGISYPCEP